MSGGLPLGDDSLADESVRGASFLASLVITVVVSAIPVDAATRGRAQGKGPLDGLGDILIDTVEEFIELLFEPVEEFIESNGDALLQLVVGTPHPDTVFSKPSNPPWPGLYEVYWGEIVPTALFLYGVMFGLVVLLETTSHLFSSYHRSKLRKRSLSGLFGILGWWWIAGFALQLMNSLTAYLVPDLSQISLFQTLSFSGLGMLGIMFTYFIDLVLFLLVGLVYYLRGVLLYLFVLLMPLLIVFWIPGVGPFAMVSRLMKRFAGFFVPLLFMTLPVTLLFKVAHVLGTSGGDGLGGVGAWLGALVVPMLALLLPLAMFWQASAVFLVASRMSRHASSRTARQRMATTRTRGEQAMQKGREALSGARQRIRPLRERARPTASTSVSSPFEAWRSGSGDGNTSTVTTKGVSPPGNDVQFSSSSSDTVDDSIQAETAADGGGGGNDEPGGIGDTSSGSDQFEL